jgi:hypothetical protein
MKFFFTILILQLLTLSSCSDLKTARFEVTNATPYVIDSLYFQPCPLENRRFFSLQPQQTKTYNLDMGKQTTDGAFGIFFKSNQEPRFKVFGYYTNGNVTEELTKIKIEPDTILFSNIR